MIHLEIHKCAAILKAWGFLILAGVKGRRQECKEVSFSFFQNLNLGKLFFSWGRWFTDTYLIIFYLLDWAGGIDSFKDHLFQSIH